MIFDTGNMYKLARQGVTPKHFVEHVLAHGFNDYNNDYRSEIHYIMKTIFKYDNYDMQSSEIPSFVGLINFYSKALYKEFFDKLVRNKIDISEDNFTLLLDQDIFIPNMNVKYMDSIKQSREKFINYVLEQNVLNLDELKLLKVLTQHQNVAEKLLSKDELKVSQPIYDYLKQHFKYKDLILNKQIEIIPSQDSSVSVLAKELVLTANYMDDFFKQNIKYDTGYLNEFFNKTYRMIFDKNNHNKDNFTFDFVKKQVQIAVDTMNYFPVFNQKTIEDMRKNYSSNNPFAKLKK